MKIGVVSDTHGNALAWKKLVEGPFAGVDVVLHAGDVLYHGPRNPMVEGYNPAGLAEAINSSAVPILIARGNCDSEVDQAVVDWPIMSPYVFTDISGLRIIICHGDSLDRAGMLAMARRYRVDMVISGHTHVPLLEREEGIVLLNPGSPSLPKGDGTPTAALIYEGNLFIVRQDGQAVKKLAL